MPAVSKAQQTIMRMALAAKRGDLKNPSPAVKKIASSMSEEKIGEFTHTAGTSMQHRKA